jgi:hypothetical protein
MEGTKKVIQLRLHDDNIYFTGALSTEPTTPHNAHLQLMYGNVKEIAQFRAPSIYIDPSTDILYLPSLNEEQFFNILLLYSEFFRRAKYIAMDAEFGMHFILSLLGQKPSPAKSPALGELTSLFLVSHANHTTDGDRCQGIISITSLPGLEGIELAAACKIQQLGWNFVPYVAMYTRLRQSCSHLPDICGCESTKADDCKWNAAASADHQPKR